MVFVSAFLIFGTTISSILSQLVPAFPNCKDLNPINSHVEEIVNRSNNIIAATNDFSSFLDVQMSIAARSVLIAVSSLCMAAAVIAYRFEIHNINGQWSETYVLRTKLSSLLTLFFLGSILFVTMSLAINSRFDWLGGILSAIVDQKTSIQGGDLQKSVRLEEIKSLRISLIDFYGGIG